VIVVDTNVLFALADRSDAHHAQCRDWLAGCDEPLLVPPTVIAEACYLIDKFLGPAAEAAFLDSVGTGLRYRFQLAELVDADLRRMAELVRRYADRRLGGTDASVIAICERLSITTVATVNRRDFANVQPRHVAALTIVP
jgi:uncharacterized protein